MPLDVLANKNHVQREHHRATERNRIASIQAAKSFRRNHQEVKAGERGKRPKPDPYVDAAASERREKHWHKDHARSGNERSLRCRREFQTGRLKRVAPKHEKPYLYSCPNRVPIQFSQRSPK